MGMVAEGALRWFWSALIADTCGVVALGEFTAIDCTGASMLDAWALGMIMDDLLSPIGCGVRGFWERGVVGAPNGVPGAIGVRGCCTDWGVGGWG